MGVRLRACSGRQKCTSSRWQGPGATDVFQLAKQTDPDGQTKQTFLRQPLEARGVTIHAGRPHSLGRIRAGRHGLELHLSQLIAASETTGT